MGNRWTPCREATRWTSAPYFLWDLPVTEQQLRERLRTKDRDARAQWQARVMREARYRDVWRYLTLEEILENWQHIRRHLGRMRGFWEFLLDGWRNDGLLAST
jgi:chromosome segregation and condensation protein ScpB